MTNRFTSNDIKLVLGGLRSKIRNGLVVVHFNETPTALRLVVAQAFGFIDGDIFNTENFNPQTLKRFAKLFDLPRYMEVGSYNSSVRYPTQDEIAWALQNFINRRAEPWAHVRNKELPPFPAEASPINV